MDQRQDNERHTHTHTHILNERNMNEEREKGKTRSEEPHNFWLLNGTNNKMSLFKTDRIDWDVIQACCVCDLMYAHFYWWKINIFERAAYSDCLHFTLRKAGRLNDGSGSHVCCHALTSSYFKETCLDLTTLSIPCDLQNGVYDWCEVRRSVEWIARIAAHSKTSKIQLSIF